MSAPAPGAPRGRRAPGLPATVGASWAVVAGCAALAALSLALPSTPSFDPWGWLVWGREVVALDLDTTSGPSWKPLPVLVSAPLSLAGEPAPELWLVVARTGWLAAMALTFALAARLAGAWAGALAGLALLLAPDPEARWIRYFFQGDSEPLLVAFGLGAVVRHLDGHRSQALLLGGLAALLRPEAWPLLGLYGLWSWRAGAVRRALVAAVLATVALLWFGGDWLGSGSPLTGAARARVIAADADRPALVWEAVSGLVTAPVWLAAGACVAFALHRGERLVLGLAGGALAWAALVGAMSLGAGFAALGRFLAPPAAVVCVLAGAGAVRAMSLGGRRTALAVALLALTLPFALPRTGQLGVQIEQAATRARLEDQLDLVLRRAGGPAAVQRCAGPAADQAGLAVNAQPALAWKLGTRVADIPRFLGPRPGVVFARVGGARERTLSFLSRPGLQQLARTDEWAVFAIDCAHA